MFLCVSVVFMFLRVSVFKYYNISVTT